MGIAMLDMASALPTWMGAYLKALSPTDRGGLGLGEEDAVYFADKTVRNAHGGGGVKDMAAIQRGTEFQKLFTMFYTFWNHNLNRLVDTGRRWKQMPDAFTAARETGDWSAFRSDVGTLLLRTMMYTLGVQVVHQMFHPPSNDEDAKGWAKWFGKSMAAAATGGIPILRDVMAHWLGARDYEMSPVEGLVHNTDQVLHDVEHPERADRFIKHALTTAGYVTGLPLGQPASTMQFLHDYWTGEQDPRDIAEWWRGITTGDIRAHNR